MSTSPAPDGASTTTREATEEELAFLRRRQATVSAEIQSEAIKWALIPSIPLFVIFSVVGFFFVGFIFLGVLIGGLVFLMVFGIGRAIAWSKREQMRIDARRRTATIKRGPFQIDRVELRPRHNDGYQINKNYAFYAVFADERLQLGGADGERLLGITLRSASVVLFRNSHQIVEVRNERDEVVYRHPDFKEGNLRA